MHRACVRTALINEISTVTAPEVVLGCRRGIASGDLGARSVLLVPLTALDVAIQIRRYLKPGLGCSGADRNLRPDRSDGAI